MASPSARSWRRAAIGASIAGLALGIWLGSEAAHWRASRDGLPPAASPPPGGRDAIVVLGYGNRGDRANAVNRYRVKAGLRSIDPRAAETILILAGGPVMGPRAEADLLVAEARRRGYAGPVRLDRESRTTWENVRNVVPLLEDAGRIRMVSNSLHARKARRYLAQQRPDLAARLVPAEDYRFGEVPLLKPLAVLMALPTPHRLPFR